MVPVYLLSGETVKVLGPYHTSGLEAVAGRSGRTANALRTRRGCAANSLRTRNGIAANSKVDAILYCLEQTPKRPPHLRSTRNFLYEKFLQR